eukprot:10176651-Heterocapsa_arctica.AAC.1
MNDIGLALGSTAGMTAWFRDAVELSRFYRGADNEDMQCRAYRTASRVWSFINSEQIGVWQISNRRWQIDLIVSELRLAITAYDAHGVAEGLTGMRLNEAMGYT